MESDQKKGTSHKIVTTALFVSIVGALAFLLSGYGYQWGWWGLNIAFTYMLAGGALLSAVALILLAVYPFVRKSGQQLQSRWMVYVTAILGLSVIGNFGYWYYQAQQYPPIHDITTDTENPPEFKAVVPLREDAPNATEYGGEEVAKIQKEHYPDLQTLNLNKPYPEAFNQALEAVRSTSWEIVGYDEQEGRIEATHTLAWYGFKDDVVIRVDTADADSNASKIDVRSVSRIGRGDIGVNAERIRDYLAKLR